MTAVNPTVARIADLLGAARVPSGDTRIVLVDGPAGAGKTTLADRLGVELGCQVLHADDMYEGWDGLATLGEVELPLLEAIAAGRAASFRRWDWIRSERAEEIVVPAADIVILEGVGVASAAARAFAALVVWVEAPQEICLARGLERDGESMREHWLSFQNQERRILAAAGTRVAAHVTIDGTAEVLAGPSG